MALGELSMQNSCDMHLQNESALLIQALSDPGAYALSMLEHTGGSRAPRAALATLGLACVLGGMRHSLEINDQQILNELSSHDTAEQTLSLLEVLFACSKMKTVLAGLDQAKSRWPKDERVIDLADRALMRTSGQRFTLAPGTPQNRFGVLDFSYAGFDHFSSELARSGSYTINLGDFLQSEGARQALMALGIKPENIVYVDRDSLCAYEGAPLNLVMNGVLFPKSLPLSTKVRPIFFGSSFHLDNMLPGESQEDFYRAVQTLRPESVIGCRDAATANLLGDLGLTTFVSGCLSQSFEVSSEPRKHLRTVICGIQSESLVSSVLQFDPQTIVLPDQRRAVTEYPLSLAGRQACREAAIALMNFYRHHAGRMVTSLLHCAGPCAAAGIPTLVARDDPDNIRFTTLAQQLTVIGPDEASAIFMGQNAKESFGTLHLRARQLDLLEAVIEFSLLWTREPA